MIRMTKELVIRLHQMMAEETGGGRLLRSEALLESAVEGTYATFGGEELYPTVEEKAARLGYALISNHAFEDGNKRIGVLVLLSYLEASGIRIRAGQQAVIDLGLGTASGQMDQEDVLAWIRDHTA